MTEEKKGMREEMPMTAEMVDELRLALGRERVDAAIKAGQAAQREYGRRVQAHGQRDADAWLKQQRFPAGLFWASEGGKEFGIRRA